MSYQEVVQYIEKTVKFGSKPGLERTQNLLQLLGNPHKRLKAIHVAGTNGKGSTTAMLANILKCAGYRTGMYISPHLYKDTERMLIDGTQISEEDFVRFALVVLDRIKEMERLGMEEPTQFEMYTAMAFLYFAEKAVDFAVIEVGLGGKYDATNVIDGLVSVITSISFDHMEVLGDTIEKIAAEKAGIIKQGSVAVTYPQRFQGASGVIENVCAEKGVRLMKADEQSVQLAQYSVDGQVISIRHRDIIIEHLLLPLLGDHQLKNTATVLTTISALRECGYTIEDEAVRKGIETVSWPCRLSILSKNPLILIDGAHNEEGIDSLEAALLKYFCGKRIIFVIGMLKDKNYRYAVEKLMPMAAAAIATEPVSERTLSAAEMAAAISPFCSETYAVPDISQAIVKAKTLYQKNSLICICGSLYLAGSAYAYLSE